MKIDDEDKQLLSMAAVWVFSITTAVLTAAFVFGLAIRLFTAVAGI